MYNRVCIYIGWERKIVVCIKWFLLIWFCFVLLSEITKFRGNILSSVEYSIIVLNDHYIFSMYHLNIYSVCFAFLLMLLIIVSLFSWLWFYCFCYFQWFVICICFFLALHSLCVSHVCICVCAIVNFGLYNKILHYDTLSLTPFHWFRFQYSSNSFIEYLKQKSRMEISWILALDTANE